MTNKELGRAIWEVLRVDGFYNNFEIWYQDCFDECIADAEKMIFSGCCTFENGSFIEISKNISKDGKTHNFNVDKENFIEFYGRKTCKELFEYQGE